MENDALYPPGWCHRKFFAPRQNRNPAKQPRKDDDIVQEVIDEQRKTLGQSVPDVSGQAVQGAVGHEELPAVGPEVPNQQ